MTQLKIGDAVQQGDLVIRRIGNRYEARYVTIDDPRLLGHGEVGYGDNPTGALNQLNMILYNKQWNAEDVVIRRRIEAGWNKKLAKKTAMPWTTNNWAGEPELVRQKGGYE